MALSADRLTRSRTGNVREIPVAAATTIHAGSMVAVNASGYAVPFSTATTLKGAGMALERVDNSGGAAGAVKVRVDAGIHRFANSADADEITLTSINADCYGVDDETVAKTSGTNTRSIAGKVFDVDAQGVWVKFS